MGSYGCNIYFTLKQIQEKVEKTHIQFPASIIEENNSVKEQPQWWSSAGFAHWIQRARASQVQKRAQEYWDELIKTKRGKREENSKTPSTISQTKQNFSKKAKNLKKKKEKKK